ncbi:unc-112-related protein [Halyomorpha halys]|uniref:unc-112-related protein n=1 Tax=Halyomorpha halys TaxID=286706 RepID=UPI0006D4CA03|nr:unc-112-related protein-like [Halyomorpha halys]
MGDGSWNLRIYVTNLQMERTLRVKGESHIGGVMLNLVENLDIKLDWSDHALWWPDRNMWLTRTRSTLDQYSVQADAFLHFTPMHKTLRVQLPDLRYLDCRVDFSIKTFTAVIQLCKELGIRHPEELSLCKPLESHHLKYNWKDLKHNKRNKETNGKNGPSDGSMFISNQSPSGSTGSLDKSLTPFVCGSSSIKPQPSQPARTHDGAWNLNHDNVNIVYSPNGNIPNIDKVNGSAVLPLSQSPVMPSNKARANLLRPKSLVERARMNWAWLDSSLSIMEQGVQEFDILRLRFKFYCFYDLNPKLDSVRINQIYEQAKWQLLNDELDCTEEEALMFAALQVQINLQSTIPQPSLDNNSAQSAGDDDIDAALSELQVTLEGSHINSLSNDITQVPELYDYLRFLKPKRFTLKAYKRFWFTYRDLRLRLYKSKEDFNSSNATPVYDINLRGCEVTPDVCLTQGKYGIKVEVPGPDGMSEMYIRCDTEEQYAKWMAACQLASKGRSLADSSYEAEVATIMAFIQMQHPAPAPAIVATPLDIVPEDYMPPKFVKRLKGKLVNRISEAHANVKSLSLIDAKMNYIKACQSLPDFGITLFVVKFDESKKEELLGVAFNRIMRMEINTGDLIKAWRYNTMKNWDVTWHTKVMKIQFENEEIEFSCLSADCKVIHQFIGGYIFLSMRSKETNQTLNEDLFHKLTGGRA